MHNFEDTWGTIKSHQPAARLSEESELALRRLQTKPIGKLSGWLSNLIDETPTEDGQQARVDTWLPKRYSLIEASAHSWIDAFLAELGKFVWEVNGSDAAEKLTIVTENPRSTVELKCRRDPSSDPYRFTCYQGHLATRDWALLLRSYYECLQVFVVRSELLLALEFDRLSTNDIRPIAEFRAVVNEDSVQWSLAGMPVSEEAIPAMARELFEDFINVALGKISEADLFLPVQTQRNSDATISHEEQRERVTAFLNSLQTWQTRALISRAVCQDLDTLMKLSKQPELRLSKDLDLESLQAQYAGLQHSWEALLKSLQCIAGQVDQGKVLPNPAVESPAVITEPKSES